MSDSLTVCEIGGTLCDSTDKLLEAVSRMDAEIFSANPWGLESYTKSAANDYDYLIAAAGSGSGSMTVYGFALLRCFDDAELIRIATAPEYRRRGAGRLLLRALIAETKKRDIHDIFLEVRSSNEAAIKLYSSEGFERAGIRRGYYSEPKEDALIMRYTC